MGCKKVKVINCEKREGQLVCNFASKSGPIQVRGSVNEKGEPSLDLTNSLIDAGVDPDDVRCVQEYTKKQIRNRRIAGEI